MTHPAAHPAFWHERWQSQQIGFHEGAPNAQLVRFWPELVHDKGRVFVPLCGKSADLAWLAGQGFEVVGAELSEIACAAFFAERGITPQREQDGPFVRWTAGAITLLQGDVFDVSGSFDAVWDRAALVALPPALRPRYAAHLRALLRPGGTMLIVTFAYDQARRDGPPFSVGDAEVLSLYSEAEKLFSHQPDEARWREVGGVEEAVWRVR